MLGRTRGRIVRIVADPECVPWRRRVGRPDKSTRLIEPAIGERAGPTRRAWRKTMWPGGERILNDAASKGGNASFEGGRG
jgi:hypothetical protein